jgi:PAS domain S-box-containing protein
MKKGKMAGQILIVDDHAFVRRGLRSLLSTRPEWTICGEASDGLEAVEKAKALQPDVVLMDISMPRMNGIEATRIIRREVPEAKVVIVSQIDPAMIRNQIETIGPMAYVAKRDLARDLIATLEQVIQQRSLEGAGDGEPAGSVSHAQSEPPSRTGDDGFSQLLADAHRPEQKREPLAWLKGSGEMVDLIRAKNWSETLIGPPEKWSPALRMMVGFLLANRFPLLLWWGPQYVSIYNDAYRPILGTKHPKALGLPVSECWNEIWHILQPLIDTPFNGGPATWMEDLELEIRRSGFTEETHFIVAYSPVPDATANGGIGGVLATVHEITDNVIGERRLRTLRDLAAKAVNAKSEADACRIAAETISENLRDIPFLALCAGSGSGFEVVCTAGIPADHPLQSLLSDASSPLAEKLRRVMQSGQMLEVDLQSLGCELPLGAWDAPPSSALFMHIPALGQGGAPGVLICAVSPKKELDQNYRTFFSLVNRQIASSIADARSHEEERKRAEALAEIDRVKTLFFSNVSHEFRTPLTLMLGPLEEALYGGKLPVQNYTQLMMVHRNGLRLLKLVNTLLDFSRIEAGRVQAVYEPTDLASLTANLASVFRSTIERGGMRLIVDCPPLPQPVYVDRDMWEKIVLNLISNAFKFTLQGEIAVELKPAGDAVELSVRDTGVGITSEEMPHIFERFYRVQNARGRTNEGSGIGLAFVYELVRFHGGSIAVESTPAVGSTFRVSIPFGKAHLPADRIQAARTQASTALGAKPYIEEALRWLPQQEAPAAPSDFPALEELQGVSRPVTRATRTPAAPVQRILLADDNADMREYVQRLLSESYEVEAVANGESALQSARERPPDLILADVMMPRMDGFSLLKELRSDEGLKSTPVILISARAGEEARIEGLQGGADDYLVKPFSARELLARIASHLAMARIRRDAAKLEGELRSEAEIERTRLQAAFSQTYAFMVFLSLDGTVIDANRAAIEGAGFTREQVVGRKFWEPWWSALPKEMEILKTSIQRVAGGESVREECQYCMADGSIRFADRTLTAVRDESGSVVMIVATGLDITEAKEFRNRLEERVHERTAELMETEANLRSVTGRLLQIQDEERRRIARELHDSAGQVLAALKMNLASAEPGILKLSSGLGKNVSDSILLVDELSRELRTISYLLHPPLLDEAGLESALRWYVDGFAERSKIKVEFDLDPELGRLPREMETAIFRMVQECLTNVHRHSGSATANIRISRDSKAIQLEVSDQGKGIPGGDCHISRRAKPGVGIQGMRERVRQLGGQFEIRSGDAGTTIVANFPVPDAVTQPVPADALEAAS